MMRFPAVFLFFGLIFIACSEARKQPEAEEKTPVKASEKPSQSQKDSIAVFKWESELCIHESTFNARLYTAEELKGTRELLWMVGGMLLSEADGTAFNPVQIEDLSTVKELDLLYQKKRKALLELKIVNDPFWGGVKKSMLREMKDEYDLTRIGIQAYTNPDILKNNRFSDVCPELIDAITGKDTTQLMAAWKTLVEEQCRNNGSPENVRKRHREAYNRPDRVLYARTELITFGWHNRVNAALPNLAHDEKINRKFDQLFLETKSECDEP